MGEAGGAMELVLGPLAALEGGAGDHMSSCCSSCASGWTVVCGIAADGDDDDDVVGVACADLGW